MTVVFHESTLRSLPAEAFPPLLVQLGPFEMGYFRNVAQHYEAAQKTLAEQQEEQARHNGISIHAHPYEDPFTMSTDREFVDTIAEIMMGMRLASDDPALVYQGNRTKGPDTYLTEAFKGLSPAMRYWRENLVPTSAALSSLYNPDLSILPGVTSADHDGFTPGQPNDEIARAIFAESLDGRAIRSRGDVVRRMYLEQFTDIDKYPEGSEVDIASLACGAAEVVFNATAELVKVRPDLKITIHLADLDTQALARARLLAESHEGLDSVRFNIPTEPVDILNRTALGSLSQATAGKGFDFIDIVGFLEYLPPRTANRFMRMAYELVAGGGVLCAANMRNTHSQLEFTENCVRWPHIVPRSLSTLASLTEQACGVAPKDLTMVLPEDGGYAVVAVPKISLN